MDTVVALKEAGGVLESRSLAALVRLSLVQLFKMKGEEYEDQ
jgi:hypothetical protein